MVEHHKYYEDVLDLGALLEHHCSHVRWFQGTIIAYIPGESTKETSQCVVLVHVFKGSIRGRLAEIDKFESIVWSSNEREAPSTDPTVIHACAYVSYRLEMRSV